MSTRYPVPQSARSRVGLSGTWNTSLTTGVSGSLDYTNANDTLSAAGTTTIVGTLARTNANDTLVASGVVGDVTGTLAYTNANDTVSSAGTTTIVGTLARTNADDSISASGTTTVTGTLATTNADDTLAASGTAGAVVGTLAYTNNDDTLSAQGSAPIQSSGGGGKPRKNYIYKGKRYVLTMDELMRLIRTDPEIIKREDIQVVYKSKKPHKVSKDAWAELQATMKSLDALVPVEDNDEQDMEDIIALL